MVPGLSKPGLGLSSLGCVPPSVAATGSAGSTDTGAGGGAFASGSLRFEQAVATSATRAHKTTSLRHCVGKEEMNFMRRRFLVITTVTLPHPTAFVIHEMMTRDAILTTRRPFHNCVSASFWPGLATWEINIAMEMC
jgi:hypothetical protein